MSNCNCNNQSQGCQGCSYRCHEVVETAADVSVFRNAFVTVREENAVYHVDNLGNTISVSRNPVFNDEYIPEAGDFKMTTVYNFVANEAYVFNQDGDYRIVALFSPGGESSS